MTHLIGLDRKSQTNPSAEDRAIFAAVQGARGVDRVAPVFHAGRVVAETFGVPWWLCKARPDLEPGDVFVRPVTGRRRTRWTPEEAFRGWGRRFRKDAALTTYDNVIAAISAGQAYDAPFYKSHTTAPAANSFYDLWPLGGFPIAGTYTGAAATARALTDADVGSLYTYGNVSAFIKRITSVAGNATAGTPTLWVYDRVLTYEATVFNANANAAFTNVAVAGRYIAAGQPGLKVMLTVQTVTGATAATITRLAYTDQGGNTGQLAPVAYANSFIASTAAPTATLGARVFYPAVAATSVTVGQYVPLLTGDSGVRKLEDLTTSAANTGTMCFVCMQPLAQIPIATQGVTQLIDQIMQVTNLAQIVDGGCIALYAFFPTATAANLFGTVSTVWG